MKKRGISVNGDLDYLEGLRERRTEVIESIYREYIGLVRRFVEGNSGTPEDAEDLFQDAIFVVYEKVRGEEFSLTSSFKTFFYSICRNLWLQHLNKNKRFDERTVDVTEVEGFLPLSDDNLGEYDLFNPESERRRIYLKHFGSLSSDCQRVLSLFAKGKSIRDITKVMGYASEDYTKARKYSCKELLKKRIEGDTSYKELKEYEDS